MFADLYSDRCDEEGYVETTLVRARLDPAVACRIARQRSRLNEGHTHSVEFHRGGKKVIISYAWDTRVGMMIHVSKISDSYLGYGLYN